ncbi:DMT family transporter [Jannaschia marina]|uniref:DMT family transporter n=1 Tax=Jannaschia marina TaxID=2741674 RepID=UPI0015CAA439|nr:DMT family transporter [Jannaschia marina]
MTALDRPGRGIALRLLSGVLFAGMAVCVKALSAAVPTGQIVFYRSAFALLPLAVFLWWRGELPGGLRTRRPVGHLLRSAFGAAAMFTSFSAIARLPLAEAILISHLSPVFTALAAVAVLSERLTVWRVLGLVLGLSGVLALVWPDLGSGADTSRLLGYGLGIATAALTAAALLMVRSLARTENPGAIAIYFVVVSMTGGLLTLPLGWAPTEPATLALLVLAGLFGGAAHIAMTLAFRYAEASRLAPFEYVALIWAALADLLLFGTPLGPSFLLALPLVLLGAASAAAERDVPRPEQDAGPRLRKP